MTKNIKFIGRNDSLGKLLELKAMGKAKLFVIKGRRRIGKSRLLQEFGKKFKKSVTLSGLPPGPGITAEKQRQEFAGQMERELGIRGIQIEDWSNLFWHLAENCKIGETLIVFDEITWMALDDHTFLPKLKNAWDLYFKRNSKLILALCGSISGWIE